MKKGLFSKLIRKRWEIGFVEGGYDAVFSDKKLQIHWVSNPPKDDGMPTHLFWMLQTIR